MPAAVKQSKLGAQTGAASEMQWLLLFAYSFPPTNETGAQRPFRFARYLKRYGYQAQVITASSPDNGGLWPHVTKAPGASPGRGVRIGASIAGAVQRVLPYNDQLPWVSHAVAAADQFVRGVRPAAVLSTSPPVACHLAALRMKWRYGLPWIADMRDPIYGNPHRSRRLARPYYALLERAVVTHADAVIANTDNAAEALRQRYPLLAHKIHLVWNGYDPAQAIGPQPIPRRGHKVLLHAGSLYPARHPGTLVASLARLAEQGRLDPGTVRLRLIGCIGAIGPWASAPGCEVLRQRGCLEFIDRVLPQPEAHREMAQADYLLLLDGNEMGMSVQVPAKLFEYIRIGRPVLAFTARNSPAERILAGSGVPHACICRDLPDEQVDRMVLSFFNLSNNPVQPSWWFQEQFDAVEHTKHLASILGQICRPGDTITPQRP